ARRLHGALADGGWLITASTDPPLSDEAPFEVVVADQGVFYRRGDPPRRSDGPGARSVAQGARGNERGAIGEDGRGVVDEGGLAGSTRALGPSSPSCDHEPDVAAVASGIRALANQDVAEAQRRCAAATERHPFSTELHYLRAVLLVALGRDDAALRAVQR